MVARRVDWAKKLNRVNYSKGSKRVRRRVDSPEHAIATQRLAVRRWLRAPYDIDDADSDLASAAITIGSGDPAKCLSALGKRPYGYSAPEPIDGQPEQEYCELVSQLVEAVTDDRKTGRILESALIQTGYLPSRSELVESGLSDWQSRKLLEVLQYTVLRVFNAEYLAQQRAKRSEHHSKRTVCNGKSLENLIDAALGIDDTPVPLAPDDLANLERELVDNLLSFDCPERLLLVCLVSSLLGNDCERLDSAVARLPIQQASATSAFKRSEFAGRYSPFTPLGESILKARLQREKLDREQLEAQKRAEETKRARIEASAGTIAQQYRARYDLACWELYANAN